MINSLTEIFPPLENLTKHDLKKICNAVPRLESCRCTLKECYQECGVKGGPYEELSRMDGWMNGVLGHFFALSRLNWAGDNLD